MALEASRRVDATRDLNCMVTIICTERDCTRVGEYAVIIERLALYDATLAGTGRASFQSLELENL